jgi:predicted O-methyltransferase YrrM
MLYDLSHLTQHPHQEVIGPIQDDEALLLFSIIRTMRIHHVIEIGGLNGYSATNFLKAIISGNLYTVDVNPVPKIADNHIVIQKDCRLITNEDIKDKIQMIFFDAHEYDAQLEMYDVLLKNNLLDEDLVLAFHDTNLHPQKFVNWAYYVEEEEAWCHQKPERRLVEHFKQQGYDAISFHTKINEPTIKFRHGLTIMKKHKFLKV